MSDLSTHSSRSSGRVRILYLVTTLVIAVFIVYGLVSWLTFRGSQSRLIEKSREKLIQTQVQSITSTADYLSSIFIAMFEEKLDRLKPEEMAIAFANREITEAQKALVEEFKKVTEKGLQGQELLLVILLPTPLNPKPTVIISSEESLIYEWEVPDYLAKAIDEGDSYIWMEEGIPELDLQGEYVMVISRFDDQETGGATASVSVKSMKEELADIEGFFDQERSYINLVMGAVVLGSVLVVFAITFFILNYLIRKRITEPVEGLAAAAGEVMEGNLDVEIEVHRGGEFEVLERTFKEMVESFRKYIARSVGED